MNVKGKLTLKNSILIGARVPNDQASILITIALQKNITLAELVRGSLDREIMRYKAGAK